MKCHKNDSRLRIYPFGGFWHVWDARHDNHTDIVKGTIAGAMTAAREYIEEAQDAEHDEADY